MMNNLLWPNFQYLFSFFHFSQEWLIKKKKRRKKKTINLFKPSSTEVHSSCFFICLWSLFKSNTVPFPLIFMTQITWKVWISFSICQGYRNGFTGKDTCSQAWRPEFNPQDPHSRRERTPEDCPLTSTCVWHSNVHTNTHTHVHAHTHRCSLQGKKKNPCPDLSTCLLEMALPLYLFPVNQKLNLND